MGCSLSLSDLETEHDLELNREADKQLKETKARLANQVKVLLLGSGDSGKSTILKQMRVIHEITFTPHEIEYYRQIIFDNLTRGLQYVLDAMEDMELSVHPFNLPFVELVDNAPYIIADQPYPSNYREALERLWEDPNIQTALRRGNEAALPENLPYFFGDLDRLFVPGYKPSVQDILHCRSRTTGIREMRFRLDQFEMLMVDVGGQKSERRKWIHYFQDVTTILFVVSLSGYDQCLVEDRDSNQMQDAMTIWDSVCHSQWFEKTSIILFLNKNDIFKKKIQGSHIKNYFSDFDGAPCDAKAGHDYFRRRFIRLARKAERAKDRDIYVHVTTATDTAMLRTIMMAVEGIMILRTRLHQAGLL